MTCEAATPEASGTPTAGQMRIHPSGQAIAWKRPGLKAWAVLWTEVGLLGLVARSRLLRDDEVADWLPLVTDSDEV